MRKIVPLLLAFLWPVAAWGESPVLARWTELGRGGTAEARLVTSASSCPNGMSPRAAANGDFPLICRGTAVDSLLAHRQAAADQFARGFSPQRIVVLGDTGCRIKPPALQDCNDTTKWPFAVLAASAAKLKPDLVIHVGDYLYRESACPVGNSGCAGTPWGDNWPTWNADFFAPAAPLLAAAPWVFVRGNHEECSRAGNGYTRLLAVAAFDPQVPCDVHLKPYAVPLGAMSLVVMDDAAAPDTSVAQNLLPEIQADYAALATIAPAPLWLVAHKPIWAAAVRGPLGISGGGNQTLIRAAGDRSALAAVQLMLSGHIHAFEALNYQGRVPPQIVAGHGGDNLDPQYADLRGTVFQIDTGVRVKDGLSVGGFGFLLMTKSDAGWTIELYRVDGTTEGECMFANARLDCTGLPRGQQ